MGSGAAPLPTAPVGVDSIAAANRTTSPDGSINSNSNSNSNSDGPGVPVAGRLSAANIPAVGSSTESPSRAGIPGPIDTDLARTVPASERMSAITSGMRANTPHATPRLAEKRRPMVAIVVGVLAGAAVAAVLVIKLIGGNDGGGTPGATATSTPEPAAAPVAPPAPTPNPVAANPEANLEGKPAAPGAGVAPGASPEAKPGTTPGEAPAAATAEGPAGEAKPGEAKTREAKPAEAKPAEAKPAEAKSAEAAPAVAETPPGGKPGRKPRLIAHKKAPGLTKAEAALEAAAAPGGADEAASDGPGGNVARVISFRRVPRF